MESAVVPEGVVSASLPRRAACYLIDLAVFVIPACPAVLLLIPKGFIPVPGPGILGLLTIAVIGAVYGLVLAAMLSKTGQSAGGRLLGLRVLAEDAKAPAPFGQTVKRGIASLGGLLLAGVGPLIFVVEFRKRGNDQDTWLHRLGESTVIDINAGVDPLNPAPSYYSPVIEDWVRPGTAAMVKVFPPKLPVWSDHSRPAVTAAPQPSVPQVATPSAPARPRLPRWVVPAVQGVVAVVVIGALSITSAWGVGFLQPLERPTRPNQISAANLALLKPPLTAGAGTGFPGYEVGPVWRKPLSATAQATAAQAGTFIFDNRALTILDNATGTVLSEQAIDGDVLFAQETQISGEPGMVWRIGDTLHGWVPSLGKAAAVTAKIPADAAISTAGTDLLITARDGKLSTLTKTGLTELTAIEGKIALGVDGDKLLSAKYSGSLTLSSPDAKTRQDVPLNAPEENQQVMKWVTAGHGLAVILWSAFPDSHDPQNPVTVAVYRESTGELLSSMDISYSRVEEDPAWVRGNGFVWAAFAGYAYNQSIGLPVLDLKAQGIKRSGILADGVLGANDEGPVFIQSNKVTPYNGVTPLAISPSGAIVKTKDNEILVFAAK
ncbi:RDD family protein [Arthrobacter sp. ISL-48]|uniref:RDD family protein n=1 Tax=Arthrobacter sp. ISL-48 TaxID=2819110 RepID=UPI001BE9045D|nr:RDD family protein [Arthrobacter sp. ISL-48]MBT2533902.1 RDD family protein [Arthrobacter sp. ISL-48]